jgi:hypothetical protein
MMSVCKALRLGTIVGFLAVSIPALAQPNPVGPSSGSFPAADAPPPPATTGTAPGAPPPASTSSPAETTAEPPPPPPPPPPAPPARSTEPQRHSEPEGGADEPEPYSRRGFFFSLGIGCSVTSLLCTADSGNGFYPAFATKFQIGAAVSDTTIVHWTSRVEWKTYANQSFDTDTGDLETSTDIHPWGIGGVGITHFFSETPTSLYIGGDIGFSNMMDLDDGDNDFGFGLCEALGWEFQPNFSVEHALCLGTADDGNDHTATSPFLASLTLNWLTN